MSCAHDNVVVKYDCDNLPDPLELSWAECLDCGEWRPLGASNDAIVGHEIALASCLAEVPDLWEPKDQEAAAALLVGIYSLVTK